MATAERTTQDLEERFGAVYDLAALAKFVGVSSRSLRETLEGSGVPVLEIGRKRIVVKELADRVLGLDRAEWAIETKRNEEAMHRLEYREDGTRKTMVEYAAEIDALAQEALKEIGR